MEPETDIVMEESTSPLLQGTNDYYDGIVVDPSSLPNDETSFFHQLRASLALWKSQNKRGIWLKLPIESANLVPVAVQQGFQYHHAERQYLMLTKWLHESDSTLPANASHVIGLGAIVLNDKNEILVVQENSGRTRGSGTWKMPTGVVGQGEDIGAAVERKVEEETKVKAEFLEVIGIRQSVNVKAAFGKTDLFFLCILRPRSSELVAQKTVIEAVKWMPFEEYKAQPFNTKSSLLTRFSEIISAYIDEKYAGFRQEVLSLGAGRKETEFYHNIKDLRNHKETFNPMHEMY